MNRRAIALLLLLLGGCGSRDTPPWSAYLHPGDALAAHIPLLGWFGLVPCQKSEVFEGTSVRTFVPIDACYVMTPARRMRGIWLAEYEGSQFFENATRPEEVVAQIRRWDAGKTDVRGTWLDDEKLDFVLKEEDRAFYRLVAVDFIGRRTTYPGHYGHFGGSEHSILIDRVIAARTILVGNRPYIER